jgi:hypothetical protein
MFIAAAGLKSGQFDRKRKSRERRTSNIDMAAKRHKKHKNKISWLVISMAYNE